MKKSRDGDTRESREPMNEFKDSLGSCVFIHFSCLRHFFIALFFGFGSFVCVDVERRQLNPNRESKDSSMDAFVLFAV